MLLLKNTHFMFYSLWGKLLGTFSSSCPQEKKKVDWNSSCIITSYLVAHTHYYKIRVKTILSILVQSNIWIAITMHIFLQETLEYKTKQSQKASLRCLKRKPLTSSTLPNPPTPSVAIISRFWKGDDEENLATFSFSWIISKESALDSFQLDMDLLYEKRETWHTLP